MDPGYGKRISDSYGKPRLIRAEGTERSERPTVGAEAMSARPLRLARVRSFMREVFRHRATAETLSPAAILERTSSRWLGVRTGWRPSCLPVASARARPDWVRSISRSRSNSATVVEVDEFSLCQPVDVDLHGTRSSGPETSSS